MRLKHIDALRGLAMLMVVYSHLMSFCINPYTPSPLGQWMRDVMLPLFFFVSGFVAYKVVSKCGLKEYGRQVWNKTKGILIPTLLMMAVFCITHHLNMCEELFHYDKTGYWFTIVLFQIVMLYLPFLMLSSKMNHPCLKLITLLLPYVIMTFVFRFVGFESQAAHLFEWVKVKGFYLYFAIGAVTDMGLPYLDRMPKVVQNYSLGRIALLGCTILSINVWGG